MSKYKTHILTEKNIVILFEDKTVSYPRSHPFFAGVREKLLKMDFSGLDLEESIEKSLKKSSCPKGVTINKGVVRIDKKRIPEPIEKKIIEFFNQGLPLYPVVNFYRNLMKNPSEESRKDLFDFIMVNKIPLTEKGMFRAYKKVTKDFKDCHTGKFDNSVGSTPEMPREEVNPNRNVTCASGLHAAAWEYAKGFSGSIIVEVQINPKDVVSVPVDYQQQKMRVCRYKVIRVVQAESQKILVMQEEEDDYEDEEDEDQEAAEDEDLDEDEE